MAPFSGASGFGTDISQLLTAATDFYFREIRGGQSRVEIRGVHAEIDSGNFIRAGGDATANGGLIVVGRVAVLRGQQGKQPPAPSISSGDTPGGYIPNDLRGWELLFQYSAYAWPQQFTEKFAPGELFALGDKSLYVVIGGLRAIVAGTNAAPGTIIAAPATFVTLSVSGVDYNYNPTQSPTNKAASLPRWDVDLPTG